MWHIEAGRGETLLLVHGAFCDYRYFEPQLEHFSATHRCVSVSLAGHHPRPVDAPEAASAEAHVEELGLLLGELGTPVHLVGHSRGGRIALHVAARWPQHLKSLVLVEPGGIMAPGFLGTAPPPAAPDMRAQSLALIERGAVEEGLRLYLDSGQGAGAWAAAPEIFRRIAPDNARTLSSMIPDRSAPLDRAVAAQVAAPTLILVGRDSPQLFHRIGEALSESLADSELTPVAGDHFCNLRDVAGFNAIVADFLAARG